MLSRSPGFTLVAVLTLALGIAANTAIFSVVNAILLRPLPYDEAERLMFLTEWSEQVPNMSFSVANLKDLRDQNTVFETLGGYNGQNFILTGEGAEAQGLSGRQVTSGMFATLRKLPILGRPFSPEDHKPGADPVALLGEGFWERRFGRDPSVLGKAMRLSGESFTVIGVISKELHGSWKTIDVFTPLRRSARRRSGFAWRSGPNARSCGWSAPRAMALAGVGIGLLAGLALARLITSLLFQTSARDPPTFSLVPLLLLTVALLACYLPARRAARVDPLVALRYE